MEKTLEELRAEADVLGIEYSKNIGAAKLAEKIEEYYAKEAAGSTVKELSEEKELDAPQKKRLSEEETLRKMVADAKAAAMKTKIVTLSSTDKRDNDVVTSVYLSCENQYFGLAKYVPLDVPVELEECLIEVARATMITLHRDEIIDGRRTGNKVPQSVRKYTISYEDMKK